MKLPLLICILAVSFVTLSAQEAKTPTPVTAEDAAAVKKQLADKDIEIIGLRNQLAQVQSQVRTTPAEQRSRDVFSLIQLFTEQSHSAIAEACDKVGRKYTIIVIDGKVGAACELKYTKE